jgi:hypothetical protein
MGRGSIAKFAKFGLLLAKVGGLKSVMNLDPSDIQI